MNSLEYHAASGEKAFWDSLQMDILTSNQNTDTEDYRSFIERSFLYSIFFRNCTSHEIISLQKTLGLKDNGYLLLLALSELKKDNEAISIDEIQLHKFIKKTLNDKCCAVGPFFLNRVSVLICEDDILPINKHQEESTALCRRLCEAIEKHYQLRLSISIGSIQSIRSISSSFLDALSCRLFNTDDPIVHYTNLAKLKQNSNFDCLETQKRLYDAVRLRKPEAYDYFGMLMEYIKPLSDSAKRNKIIELLILVNNAQNMDMQYDTRNIDYVGLIKQLIEYSSDQLIEYGYQLFIFITSYVKPQNTIDYSNHVVTATREYLETHYAEDISLEDMAAYVNISPQYFSKLIKKNTGFNFTDWLSMFRVKKAKELLNNSNLTVKEICFMVGYKDPNYFSRIFKKRIGITPSEYVKSNSFLSSKN